MNFAKYNQLVGSLGFMILLITCNLHLLQGSPPSGLIYSNQQVAAGEWWRILTHPFVHVSGYHLLLDGAAVMLLWSELKMYSTTIRLYAAAICAISSLVAAVWLSPYLAQSGYCGLSGMAHGLMLFLGLVWLFSPSQGGMPDFVGNSVKIGGGLLVLLSGGKALYEVVTGNVLFNSYHLGELGIPIVHAHLGGALGGLLCWLLISSAGMTVDTEAGFRVVPPLRACVDSRLYRPPDSSN